MVSDRIASPEALLRTPGLLLGLEGPAIRLEGNP